MFVTAFFLSAFIEIEPIAVPVTEEILCKARLSDVFEGRDVQQGNLAHLLECWRAHLITNQQFTRATNIMFPRE
jgi:hypothetical protein